MIDMKLKNKSCNLWGWGDKPSPISHTTLCFEFGMKLRLWRCRISSWQGCWYLGNIPVQWWINSLYRTRYVHSSIVNRWRIPNTAGEKAWSRKAQGALAQTKVIFFSMLTPNKDKVQKMWEDAQFWVLLSSELHTGVSRMCPVWPVKVPARPRWLAVGAVNAPAAIRNLKGF